MDSKKWETVVIGDQCSVISEDGECMYSNDSNHWEPRRDKIDKLTLACKNSSEAMVEFSKAIEKYIEAKKNG